MSDFTKALDNVVNESDWKRMAGTAGLSVADLKSRIVPALEAEASNVDQDPTVPEFSLTDVAAPEGCLTREFEISIWKFVGLKCKFTLCGTSASDWEAKVELCLIVAGACVLKKTFVLDPHHIGSCFKYDANITKVDLCFELVIKSDKICPNIHGRVGLWWPFSWHYENFDITPFCVPFPH